MHDSAHLFMTQDLEEIGECMIKSHLWHIQYEDVSQCPDFCVCVFGDFFTPPIKPNSINNSKRMAADSYGETLTPGPRAKHLHLGPRAKHLHLALALNSRGNLGSERQRDCADRTG
uniref:Uncharacterized protein n=1 Tax=Colobus angolensis palliatus TaxID=336983 RepID=A0A2K5K7Q5_COLAP